MAFTFTAGVNSVFGNQRVLAGVLTADAATGVVSFGLGAITGLHWAPRSMATSLGKLRENVDANGTAAGGTVAVTGVAAGDTLFLTVYGR